ncbi:MAG TPA: methyltransferase domain-containing protein [Dehalococcoidia bacterium]|nr:methyltransferase domain-containing protein [Dehalococcoidia bacterium]
MTQPGPTPFRPEHFRREDESPDEAFYSDPRLVVHIDDHAIEALRGYLRETIAPGAEVLDLMSSWRSHLPDEIEYKRVVGLGMNDVELAENPQLTQRIVQNLNVDPRLPFADAEFDVVLCTVSVQYLTRPVEVFAEVARVLRPNGRLVVSFSNRLFPSKAIALWRYSNDGDHAQIVMAYLRYAGGYEAIEFVDRSPRLPYSTDPMYIVTARRSTG